MLKRFVPELAAVFHTEATTKNTKATKNCNFRGWSRSRGYAREPRVESNQRYPAAASGTAPNLRSRAWNSSTASRRSAVEKSGHIRRVKWSSA